MKRTFTIITVLISLSLISIIVIQVSWIKSMISLREEQIKQRIMKAAESAGEDLVQQIGIYAPSTGANKLNLAPEGFSLDIFKPVTVGRKYDQEQIRVKVQRAFLNNDLKDVPFEFGVATIGRYGENYFEKQSNGFANFYQDTANYMSLVVRLDPPSGSPGENLSVNEILVVVVPVIKNLVYQSLQGRIILSVLFTLIILAAFYLTVRTMLRQKKMGEIKNDFINNMTHEFKTPIATISLAVDAMRNEKVIQDRQKMGYFSDIIKEENQRMNRQVETILRASQLEKQEVDLNLKPLHVHEIIQDVVDNFALQLEDKKGKVELELNAPNDLINADEVHFSNLVNNLVDNAVKYAKENIPPLIKLSTQSNAKHFTIRIEDNGIGMNKDTVKRIFEKFYRAHTGNVHNVKGFGLGLSYVKTMVEAHDGDIKAESTLGKGSIFTVDLPLKRN